MRNVLKFLPLNRHDTQRVTEVLATLTVWEVLAHTLITALAMIAIPTVILALYAYPAWA